MYIKLSYDQDFVDYYMYLKGKYSKDLFNLEGIGDQLDIAKFSRDFFSIKTVADISVDPNSNVSDNSVMSYTAEISKASSRLNSLYLLWKGLRKLYGLSVANEFFELQLTGDIYVNDMSEVNKAYCCNIDCMDIANKGLPFVDKVKSEPPKHLSSFVGQMIHFMVYASNSVLGAVGLGNFLIIFSYYSKKLLSENPDVPKAFLWKQIKQELQSFIYSANQPFRSSIQSGFYNVSIYDDAFLKNMADEYVFPDGSMIDIEHVKLIQDLYIDLMNTTLETSPITFPVTTACIAKDDNGKVIDYDFIEYIAKKNQKFAFINIFSGKSSILSSCCFHKDTVVECMIDGNYINDTFENIYEILTPDNELLIPDKNGQYVGGRIVAVSRYDVDTDSYTKKMYKINDGTDNYKIVTDDHIHPTTKGDLKTTELQVGDAMLCVNNIVRYIRSIEEYDCTDDFVFCFEMDNEKDPYFKLPDGLITHNCRLRSEQNNEYFNSFGSGGSRIGSLGVVTINLPRVAYTTDNREEYLKRVVYLSELCVKINNVKRNLIQRRIDENRYPLYNHGFMELIRQYSTIGITGLNESLDIMGYDILNYDGQQLTYDIIETINDVNEKASSRYKAPHNLEQVPAEGSAIKLASKDRLLKYNDTYELYSNQFIPLIKNADILDRLKIQGMFDDHMTGGAICHLNVEEQLTDYRDIAKLIKKAIEYGVVYHAINYNLQGCENGHMSVGKRELCPICNGKITDNYHRIVGFLTKVKSWHKVRRDFEYVNRQWYKGVSNE